MIGGFILDWGPEFFSKFPNTALIVRGDRPDVQLSAIQSGNLNVIIANFYETYNFLIKEIEKDPTQFQDFIQMTFDGTPQGVIDSLDDLISGMSLAPQDRNR